MISATKLSSVQEALFQRSSSSQEGGAHKNGDLVHSSKLTHSDKITALQPSRRISRDEMNLAEFPLAVLSTRSNSGLKTLEFSDQVYSKNGDPIQRSWIITGADKFGLPTASDDEVLLGLLKLTVDSQLRSSPTNRNGEFSERKIFFSRYELLKALRWTTEGRSYTRLTKALDRLSGVRIKATNAFYDNESKAHSTRNFGLIDAYEINDGRASNTKPSYFIWSETIFRSFRAGFIKKLDLDFYLDLRSAISKRLYRFLDKHFWYRATFKVNVFVLAHEKIGISRNYQHLSSIRQHLDPAFEELIGCGFLSGVEYQGRGANAEVTIIAARGSRKLESKGNSLQGEASSSAEPEIIKNKQDSMRAVSQVGQSSQGMHQQRLVLDKAPSAVANNWVPSNGTKHGGAKHGVAQYGDNYNEQNESERRAALVSALGIQLVERGIKEQQVSQLLASRDLRELIRIGKIINYFDSLCSSRSPLVSRSPVGFLYRAVQNSEHFVLPGEIREQVKQVGKLQRTEPKFDQAGSIAASAPQFKENLESRYLVARKIELRRLKEEAEEPLINGIRSEVESKMIKLKDLISAARFTEAIEHAVDEKLLKLFAFPDFREWERGQGG